MHYLSIYLYIYRPYVIFYHILLDMYHISADPWVACWTLGRFNLPFLLTFEIGGGGVWNLLHKILDVAA